jgi:hypothetical protein
MRTKAISTGSRALLAAAEFLLLVFGIHGSLPAQPPASPGEPLRLSVDAAVQAALADNTSIQLAEQSKIQTEFEGCDIAIGSSRVAGQV